MSGFVPVGHIRRRVFTDLMTQTDEIQAIDQVADRLRERFPEARADRIRSVVTRLHHEYDGRPVRDFIPVLVEREAVEQLRTTEIMKQRTRR